MGMLLNKSVRPFLPYTTFGELISKSCLQDLIDMLSEATVTEWKALVPTFNSIVYHHLRLLHRQPRLGCIKFGFSTYCLWCMATQITMIKCDVLSSFTSEQTGEVFGYCPGTSPFDTCRFHQLILVCLDCSGS